MTRLVKKEEITKSDKEKLCEMFQSFDTKSNEKEILEHLAKERNQRDLVKDMIFKFIMEHEAKMMNAPN